MAGIDFDRQVFATPTEAPKRQNAPVIGAVVLVVAIALAGLVGYKLYTDISKNSAESSSAAQVEDLKQQLAEMQKRLDAVEKHRKPAPAEIAAVAPPVTQKTDPPAKIIYRVMSASKMPAVAPAAATPANNGNTAANAAMESAVAANHEAWQATTNRLADVVGAVGTQQGEISETREVVNQLLAQSRRKAVPFELQKGSNRTPIGPLSLQLKSVDSRGQRYSVCVYFQDKCIELKDRVLNEVVVFVVQKDSPPLEFVATKIVRDQILGFVEVPVSLQ